MHLVPVGAFDGGVKYDLRVLQQTSNQEHLAPINATHPGNLRFNFDGILTFDRDRYDCPAISYLQVFRNGIIESVSTTLAGDHNGHPIIPGARFEQIIVQSLAKHIRIHSILEIEPPYFLLVSVLGVEAHNLLGHNDGFGGYGNNPIDRNDLLIPEILVEDNLLPPQSVLKPAFDALWNSAGRPESPFYDCHGSWNPT